MNFWDDRPILAATNHHNEPRTKPTFPFFPWINALPCRGEMIE